MTMAKKKKNDKMQALIKSDNSIIRDLRDQQWLYNPRVFAQVSGDFSLMHQRVLLGVLDKLQDRITNSINENRQDGQLWLPLFSPDEMNTSIDFNIEAKDLGVTPGHYPELVQALSDLISIRMGYLKENKNGTTEYHFANLFSRLEMVKNSSDLRTGKIRVKMDKENVNDFLSMNHGYTDHAAKIGQMAKKQRTPRIYIYLSTFRDIGRKQVDYPEFCEFLGIDDDSYVASHSEGKKEASPTDNPFHKYSKVKKLILEPTRLEMDQLSAEKKIDFSFTYEARYNDGRKKGNPTHIEFVIVPGPLYVERDFRKRRHNQEQSLINSLTLKYSDLKPYDIVELLRDVQDSWFDDFKSYAYDDIPKAVERKQPDHVAEYILALFADWLKNKQLEARRKEIEDQRQYELFQKQEQEKWRGVWRDCLAELSEQLPWLTYRNIGFESFGKNDAGQLSLVLWVSENALYERMELPDNVKVLAAILRKFFPGHWKLNYRVPKQTTT